MSGTYTRTATIYTPEGNVSATSPVYAGASIPITYDYFDSPAGAQLRITSSLGAVAVQTIDLSSASSGSGTYTYTPGVSAEQTYTIELLGGTTTCNYVIDTATVTVVSPLNPEGDISVSPSTISLGGSVTASYSYTDFANGGYIHIHCSQDTEYEHDVTEQLSASSSGGGTYTFTPTMAGSYAAYLWNGNDNNAVDVATFTVNAVPTPTPTPTPTVTPTATPTPIPTLQPTPIPGSSGAYRGYVTVTPSSVDVGDTVEVTYSIQKNGQWSETDNVLLEVVNPDGYGVSRLLRFFADESNQFDYKLRFAGNYTFRLAYSDYPNYPVISSCTVTAVGETPSEYQPWETDGFRVTNTTASSQEVINLEYYTTQPGTITIREENKVIYTRAYTAAGGGAVGVSHVTTDTDKSYTYYMYRDDTQIDSVTLTWLASPLLGTELAVYGHISTDAPRDDTGLNMYHLTVGESASVTYRLKSIGEASLRYSESYPSFKENNRVVDSDYPLITGESASISGTFSVSFDEPGYYTYYLWAGDQYRVNGVAYPVSLITFRVLGLGGVAPGTPGSDFWSLGSYDGTYNINNYLTAVNWISGLSVPTSLVSYFNISTPMEYKIANGISGSSVAWFDMSIGSVMDSIHNALITLTFPFTYVFNVTYGVLSTFISIFGWATGQLSVPIMLITLVTELIPDEIMNVALLLFGFDLFFIVIYQFAPQLVAGARGLDGLLGAISFRVWERKVYDAKHAEEPRGPRDYRVWEEEIPSYYQVAGHVADSKERSNTYYDDKRYGVYRGGK